MATQIAWARALVEVVVIVGSILLAFGIDAWWDGRQDRARASAHVAALLEDVSANLLELDETMHSTDRELAAARTARELFASGWRNVPRDSMLALLIRQGGISVHEPVTKAYDQVVATGDLRLLSPAIRDALSAWQRELQTATAYLERNSLDHRVAILAPYLVEETALAEMLILLRPEFASQPVRFANDLERMATDRRLDNLLLYKLLLGGDQLRSYQILQAALMNLAAVLEGRVPADP